MADLAAQIREQLSPMPTVDEWGQWARRAYGAIMAVLDDHADGGFGHCRRCVKLPGDANRFMPFRVGECPTVLAIAEKLGIEVDRG